MTEKIVAQRNVGDQAIAGADWEEQSYREGCAYARERAVRRLEALDDELLRLKPKGLKVEGFRRRTLVTRFGEVVVRRRMYRDEDADTVFALDDHLGWKPRQQASPSLTESIVSIASAAPFRMASALVSGLTAGELSAMTMHRLLSGVGQSALEEEYDRWESCFLRGEDVCDGQRRVEVLYTEADGVWVYLQREGRKHYEVKSGIAYRGWQSVGGGRYVLVGKRVYAHAQEAIPFWEGASLEWGKQYALGAVKRFVVGGDGADWIRQGTYELPNAVFQLDGFHLARACGRGYGKKLGRAIYEAIRSGSHERAHALASAAAPAETRTVAKDRRYVEHNVVAGIDWRNRVTTAPPDARSLGTMESNGDKLTANRMKKRGMSWTIRGARRMAKVIQLAHNDELSRFCHHRRRVRRETTHPTRSHRQTASKTPTTEWLDTSMPAMYGPYNSRPWVRSLRNLAHPTYRLR